MTELLVIAELTGLPAPQQDEIARWILDKLEMNWEAQGGN